MLKIFFSSEKFTLRILFYIITYKFKKFKKRLSFQLIDGMSHLKSTIRNTMNLLNLEKIQAVFFKARKQSWWKLSITVSKGTKILFCGRRNAHLFRVKRHLYRHFAILSHYIIRAFQTTFPADSYALSLYLISAFKRLKFFKGTSLFALTS